MFGGNKQDESATDTLENLIMMYRRLGRSGLKVSEISLGSWLTFGHSVDQETTTRCVHRAFESGINLIDTADVYALGACESALGVALAQHSRKDYVLATKVFFPTGSGPNDRGLSRKHMRESLDGSLRRLKTDYIDLYQCHRFDPDVPLEELVTTMEDFIRAGKILYWGVSMWNVDALNEVVGVAERCGARAPVSNQPNYNLLERDIEAEILPTTRALGIGQIVYSPLAQGLLTGKYKNREIPVGSRGGDVRSNQFILNRMSDGNFAKIERLRVIAERAGLSMSHLALAYCLKTPDVASAIIGVTRPEQIEDNVRASGRTLSADILRDIEDALR